MTISKAHAQMLATLACDSRPTGARRWDEAAVMAEIAKLRDRSLSSVALAVLRAAADRGAERPEVIGSSGSHWSDTMLPTDWVPNALPAEARCSICSLSEVACRMRWAGDHTFQSAAMAAREVADSAAEATQVAIAALRDELKHTPKREAAPAGLDALAARDPQLKARVDELRANNAGLESPPLQEPETGPPLREESVVEATGATREVGA